ncbi:DNA-directed RNA polymerase [Brucella tritici]|uniref:DNA-directed RNA polymerase n=1 Tax=Brucella tritici TaxID=94626 RepID=UPI00142F17A1|nr:DNA-directed RNA polymerase [Brucella tritici]
MSLEKEMLVEGRQRMKDRIDRAIQKRDMNRMRPHRSLLKEWVLPVSEGIKAWMSKMSSKRGPKPIALPRLQELEPETAAVVALKSMLRMLSIERRAILAVATEIGTWCEHEARCQKWKEEEPQDWKETAAHYAKRGSNAAHQKRSRISLFNKYVWEKIGWIAWTDTDRIRVGLELINIIIETTRRFFIIPDPEWVPKRMRGGVYSKRPYVLEADNELLQWVASAMDDELVHAPVYMPTLIPPLDWTGPRDGGYYTPFVKTPFLIRIKHNQQDTKQNALEEFEALDMPEVYAALNRVQCTPWQINRRVFDVAKEVWDKDLALAGLPRQEEIKVPPRPYGVEEGTEEYKEWQKLAGDIRTSNAKRVSKFLAYRRAFSVADRFKDEPEFYFPHYLDFRGRMYPIPSDLSPQGQDLHRGLLTFARPKPVGLKDAGWLAIHLANCFGVDKVSYDDRIEWVEQRNDQWLSIDEDPLLDRRWIGKDDDDNWQRLAAIFEWARWLREGEGMMSALPVRVDGTCNGIQHLSAMVLDEEGGASVNLIPSEKPRDIYQEVADQLTEVLIADINNPIAEKWLELFEGAAPRSVTKRPVMILPYGGTTHAYFSYTMDWLKKADPHGNVFPVAKTETSNPRVDAVNYLVKLIRKAVEGTVKRPVEVMEWLQQCAKESAKRGLPLWWRTPVGFYVRQFYGEKKGTRIDTNLDGQRIMLQNWHDTNTLDVDGQTRAVAPNFVHSLDASALMSCVNLLGPNGIECFTSIHDAYGSVAADMHTLASCLREAFILTYSEPVLENYRLACIAASAGKAKMPKPLAKGSLDISKIRDANYFFA